MGTFNIDPTRASMSADSSRKQIQLWPPSRPSAKDKAFWDRVKRSAARRGSPQSSVYFNMRSPHGDDMPQRPFTAQSTLSSMFNGNLDILRNNDMSGIAGDLFPTLRNRPHTSFASISMTEDSEAELQDINMQDFIDLDDDESDSDEPSSATVTSPTNPNSFPDFTTMVDTRNDSLLGHLDQQRGLVGSFRRNQNHAKHISSLPAHPAHRASTSEHNALQKGRRAAANTPITPARKNRISQDLSLTGSGVKKAVGNPLAARRPHSRGGSSSALQQTLSQPLL